MKPRSSRPPTRSAGSAGSRGSRGIANSGAQEATETNQGGDERLSHGEAPDLRGRDARGGGGASSGSSRSADKHSK